MRDDSPRSWDEVRHNIQKISQPTIWLEKAVFLLGMRLFSFLSFPPIKFILYRQISFSMPIMVKK